MENYTIYQDFESYVNENKALIEYLNTSLLSDLVIPIVKTLSYLENLNEEEELSKDNEELFAFGFEYLFENLEQIKLYLQGFKNNYETLEAKSIYIKMIFQLEEFKVELQKKDNGIELKNDLKKIDESISFFEDCLETNQINEHELDSNLRFFYELMEEYDDILLMSDAFNEYCASYGI